MDRFLKLLRKTDGTITVHYMPFPYIVYIHETVNIYDSNKLPWKLASCTFRDLKFNIKKFTF